MDILDRVKKILLTPDAEWSVIAGESTPPATLMTGYVLPLAGVSAVAAFIGRSLVGQSVPLLGNYRVPVASGLGQAVVSVVMAAIGIFLLSMIIDALAPTFGAQKNSSQAIKVAAYSATPAWVAGVLQILPVLGVLAIVGALYCIYLLYLGLPRLMKCPQDKALGYTGVVIVCVIVISLVVGSLTTMMFVGSVPGVGGVNF
ncbi:MAG TPA: Yip1 family protein [Vicinamibacterales bacterium]|nr:Yip1 family protein [Vicinamibacterales bacterium]